MTGPEALSFLHKLGEASYRLDLSCTRAYLSALKLRKDFIPSVLVAGTNGKGSTVGFLSHIVKAASLKVGTFTSPHLHSPTERIQINHSNISLETFAKHLTQLLRTQEKHQLEDFSYYEATFLIACLHFQQEKPDLAIWEIGLGGRLDACNALTPLVSIVAKIDLDHTHILGDSLEEIAPEKLAICNNAHIAIVGAQAPELNSLMQTHYIRPPSARQQGDAFLFEGIEISLGLQGRHQAYNANLAVSAATSLIDLDFAIDTQAIITGLASTRVAGRMEPWQKQPEQKVLLDTAHNPASILALCSSLPKNVHIGIGMLADKDWRQCLAILHKYGFSFSLLPVAHSRSWAMEDAIAYCTNTLGIAPPSNASIDDFLKQSNNDAVLCGSTYLVAEARAFIQSLGFIQTKTV